MLGVEDEREVERLGLQARTLAVLADEGEDVLGRTLQGVRIAEHEGMAEVVVGLRLVGVGDHRREAGDELHGLAQVRLDVEEVGRRVVGVGRQDRAGKGVHEILARRADERVLLEAVRQAAVFREEGLPFSELAPGGQFAEQEQVRAFLEAETLLGLAVLHEVHHVDAPVEELARHGHLLAFAHHVAVDRANRGQPHEDARPVAIAKPTLDVVLLVQRGVKRICAPHIGGTCLQPGRINHRLRPSLSSYFFQSPFAVLKVVV